MLLVHGKTTETILGAAINLHRELGPGLYEGTYEQCLARELELRGIACACQVPVQVSYKGLTLDAEYRMDMVVMEQVVLELKSVDRITAPDQVQLLTYLRLAKMETGLLLNFNTRFLKDGIVRMVNTEYWKQESGSKGAINTVRHGGPYGMETQCADLTEPVIGAAIEVHRELGPGLLPSAYCQCLCHEFRLRDIDFLFNVELPVDFKGVHIDCGYKVDFLIQDTVVVKVQAVESVTRVHDAQMLTYLKLAKKPTGLLLNFHEPVLKDGIHRYVR